MPISVTQLRSAAGRSSASVLKSLSEARSRFVATAFLCHSHKDADLAQGLVTLLGESGWQVYVDWKDTEMPPKPDRQTAERIQKKIVELRYFLFLATENSTSSKWCPWEIGYANGTKSVDDILIIPTSDGQRVHGNEYLELYRRIDIADGGLLGAWRPRESQGVFVRNL